MKFEFISVVGVFTKHFGVSTQTNIAFARVFGGDTNHGAKYKIVNLGYRI